MKEIEKQAIEEMAKVIENRCDRDCIPSCDECIAQTLYNAGYRKQSEVAREIFEEIENRLLPSNTSGEYRGDSVEWFDYYDLHLAEDIAELKKKYTGGET